MIYEGKFFDQTVNNKERTYDNIQIVEIAWGDDYTTDCLLDHYKIIIIIIDLSK